MVCISYVRLRPVFSSKGLGKLAVSRALGDFKFKKNKSLIPEDQIITANPEVTVHDITKEDEFLVLASDGTFRSMYHLVVLFIKLYEGIWDCMSSQEVIDLVRFEISERKELHKIGEMLCDYCLAQLSSDNMTVIIVAILSGRKNHEWYSWMTHRENGIDSYPESHLESSTEELGGKADPVEG
jgi:protein phosphatase PTC2/3